MKVIINGIKYAASQENPYGYEWIATDENYSASTDDEGNWHHDAPVGEGDTAIEAIMDLLMQQSDLMLDKIEHNLISGITEMQVIL
jgi:hypothetical protein